MASAHESSSIRETDGQPGELRGGMVEPADKPPASQRETSSPPPVQSQMMNDQLTAPTLIPKQVAENEPPPESFDASGSGGLGGSPNDSGFQSPAQPVVKAVLSKPFSVSSGVATGLLIHKVPPAYPPIAKAARVSGTVVLQVTITKTGNVQDLHVVSGPPMLRQSAIDAVRTWRYKPYKLDNKPIDVETTINVVFSLGV